MIKPIFFAAITAFAITTNSFANTTIGRFAPENGMWIGTDEKAATGITQDEFNKVIDDINLIYAPIVKNKGGKLSFERKWTDGTVNAYASRSGKTWNVAMFGGLARYNTMNSDGFALVVCHELSHHLGGAPKLLGNWASNEGQSDYAGTMKCLREYFKNRDNLAAIQTMKVDLLVTQKCTQVYADPQEKAICIRSSMAGKILAGILNDLEQGQKPVSFETPDSHVVSQTNDEHPEAQCRLDTYFAGALCNKDLNQTLSNSDPVLGTCNTSTGDKIGTRPLCWFKP